MAKLIPWRKHTKKIYICVDTHIKGDLNTESRIVLAQQLPWLYNVPHDECIFYTNLSQHVPHSSINKYIVLTHRFNEDYEQHLKILKIEHLLNG